MFVFPPCVLKHPPASATMAKKNTPWPLDRRWLHGIDHFLGIPPILIIYTNVAVRSFQFIHIICMFIYIYWSHVNVKIGKQFFPMIVASIAVGFGGASIGVKSLIELGKHVNHQSMAQRHIYIQYILYNTVHKYSASKSWFWLVSHCLSCWFILVVHAFIRPERKPLPASTHPQPSHLILW